MALGKGLDSLIQSDNKKETGTSELDKGGKKTSNRQVLEIRIDKIEPNPHQPRKEFSESELQELVRSIEQYGVMQPVTVTPVEESGKYELIAGERRVRAAEQAGLNTIPAILKDVTPQEKVELALIENIQREDLNPIEQARGYKGMMEKFDMTQQQIAQKVGKSRSTVANTVRLLELPQEIHSALKEGKISAGKARTLLRAEKKEEMLEMLEKMLEENISVRELEQRLSEKGSSKKSSRSKQKKDPNIIAKEKELEDKLGTKIDIKKNKRGKGKIRIDFYSIEELKRILDQII